MKRNTKKYVIKYIIILVFTGVCLLLVNWKQVTVFYSAIDNVKLIQDISKKKDLDDSFYLKCIQNLNQGNSMVYDNGYYYFRSQTEDYSLCRSIGPNKPVEILADQIPGSIYVEGDQVYFVNISDGQNLYVVGTDGKGLTKLGDFPVQYPVFADGRIYFLSVYEREADPFYQLLEPTAYNDRFLYSMNLDGSERKLVVSKTCFSFTCDGQNLYYQNRVMDQRQDQQENQYILYRNNLDGTDEQEILVENSVLLELLPYQSNLYWRAWDEEQHSFSIVQLTSQGEQKILAGDVSQFSISEGSLFLAGQFGIQKKDLATGEECLLVKSRQAGAANQGMFLANGRVLARYYESEETGVLWHVLDEGTGVFEIFEDMDPLKKEESFVLDSSLSPDSSELLFYLPGQIDKEAERYLDGELNYKNAYKTDRDGNPYGIFSVRLPHFGSNIQHSETINHTMEVLMNRAMDIQDDFFESIEQALEYDPEYGGHNWNISYNYDHLYVGGNVISLYLYLNGYNGGVRSWQQDLPLTFNRTTGQAISMDQLFNVDRTVYLKRLTSSIYKYCEKNHINDWNESFDNNVLVKNLNPDSFYLTPDGIVLCYDRYAIMSGAAGNPKFEIPYSRFEDILAR